MSKRRLSVTVEELTWRHIVVLDIQILAFNDGVNGLEYPQTVAHGVYADLSEITLVEVYQHVAGNIVIWETTVS